MTSSVPGSASVAPDEVAVPQPPIPAAGPALAADLDNGTGPETETRRTEARPSSRDTEVQPPSTTDSQPRVGVDSPLQASPGPSQRPDPQASQGTDVEPSAPEGTDVQPSEAPEPGARTTQAGDVPAPPSLAASTTEDHTPRPRQDAERPGNRPSTAVVASTELSLSIPAIDVQSVLNPLGLDGAGALEVPARGPHYDEAAWFTGSPYPGETGPTVLLGHVNGRGGAPSVFYRLAELGIGDVVTVSRPDGTQVTFEVYDSQRYQKDEFPTQAVYGDTAGSELRVITCGGDWDASVGHYRDNVVVYARLVGNG